VHPPGLKLDYDCLFVLEKPIRIKLSIWVLNPGFRFFNSNQWLPGSTPEKCVFFKKALVLKKRIDKHTLFNQVIALIVFKKQIDMAGANMTTNGAALRPSVARKAPGCAFVKYASTNFVLKPKDRQNCVKLSSKVCTQENKFYKLLLLAAASNRYKNRFLPALFDMHFSLV
jgi:hypothetical protein